jgi:sterol desaturase/sphingolipid hydroxylase (fatty acid hydroxylase superfamily)
MALSPQVVAIPLYLGLMALELVEVRRERREEAERGLPPRMIGYEPKDTATSLTMGIGSLVVGAIFAGIALAFDFWVYDHRVVDLGSVAGGASGVALAAAAWVLLLLLDDLCYYWFHRVHHESRFFWAAHVTHHSSQKYNLSTALRQSWTPLTSLPFYIPVFLLGFTPAQWAFVHGLNLVYQFWIHTEAIDRMWRPFELVMNTPSHHRVHHGSNPQYLDRNYGGILIVWDRWFGTFEPEVERVRYGLTRNIASYNPFYVAYHEFVAIGRDVGSATSWSDRWRFVFANPGWAYSRKA